MSASFFRRPAFVLLAAALIVAISFGVRQSFGLFMRPISADLGWGREVLSLALAVQTLLIGLAAPFAGAIADKWGPIRVIMAAGAVFAVGMLMMGHVTSPTGMMISAGILAGIGISGCGLPLVLSVAGRIAPDDKRSLWLGIVTAGSTAGQLLIVPLSQQIIGGYGWVAAVLGMALLAGLIVPITAAMSGAGARALETASPQNLSAALREASGHSGYWLLTIGFFTCGFHVAFIGGHLPAYIEDITADPTLGATAIAVIGFFNMIGTWTAGWLGGKYRKKYLLSLIYLFRSLAIALFISMPASEFSVLLFSAILGLLWVGTVPLTSGLVAQVFGPRYMATLFGIVFLSHQVGGFVGVWLGGRLFDATGSYDTVWLLAIALGIATAIIHMPINDQPVARLAMPASR
jgi:MFS family permease